MYGPVEDGGRGYVEYELEFQDRRSIEQIKVFLEKGYPEERIIRDHLNYLEDLLSRIREILRAEEGYGYTNETLKHDFRNIQGLLQRLSRELDDFDR